MHAVHVKKDPVKGSYPARVASRLVFGIEQFFCRLLPPLGTPYLAKRIVMQKPDDYRVVTPLFTERDASVGLNDTTQRMGDARKRIVVFIVLTPHA